MSKRLQIMIPDEEYRAVAQAARRHKKPIGQLVRESLRNTLAHENDTDPEDKIAAVLRFARFAGPTGNIDRILEEIERGRSVS